MKFENPLFSIIIVTYDSAEYVLETLESAKTQTYQNIELIITDDYSSDNTVEICREWLKENKERFVRTELITVEKNTGISPNCNRGFKFAHGEWVKSIAGDDILNPDCISTFVRYIKIHPDIFFFFSDIELFGTGEFSAKRDKVRNWIDKSMKRIDILSSSKEQYNELILNNIVCSPGAIYQLQAFNVLGGFDEEIKLLEDYPFWIKATKSGYKIVNIKEKLIKYRVNEYSVQTSPSYQIAYELFLQKYIFKNILFKFIIGYINQLNVSSKDKILCNLLKIISIYQRLVWKQEKKKIKNSFHIIK